MPINVRPPEAGGYETYHLPHQGHRDDEACIDPQLLFQPTPTAGHPHQGHSCSQMGQGGGIKTASSGPLSLNDLQSWYRQSQGTKSPQNSEGTAGIAGCRSPSSTPRSRADNLPGAAGNLCQRAFTTPLPPSKGLVPLDQSTSPCEVSNEPVVSEDCRLHGHAAPVGHVDHSYGLAILNSHPAVSENKEDFGTLANFDDAHGYDHPGTIDQGNGIEGEDSWHSEFQSPVEAIEAMDISYPAPTHDLRSHSLQPEQHSPVDQNTCHRQEQHSPVDPINSGRPKSQQRKRASARTHGSMPMPRLKSVKCAACPKNFIPSPDNDGVHCTRCFKKIFKAHVGPPIYTYDPSISSYAEARNVLCPGLEPLTYEGEGVDDVEEVKRNEHAWVDRFIRAANTPYLEESGPPKPRGEKEEEAHDHYLKQQSFYNKKPYHESSKDHYHNRDVNLRMRFLFQAVLTFHEGGPAVYPLGGDNRGYGDDKTLKCSERLRVIAAILATDKRVLMNVVEGRGVCALAANPSKFAERKTQNKTSNERKKGLIAKGEEALAMETDMTGLIGEDEGEGNAGVTSPVTTEKKRKSPSAKPDFPVAKRRKRQPQIRRGDQKKPCAPTSCASTSSPLPETLGPDRPTVDMTEDGESSAGQRETAAAVGLEELGFEFDNWFNEVYLPNNAGSGLAE